MTDPVLEKMLAINKIADNDEEYRKMRKEYMQFEKQFTKFVNRLPRKYRNFLWGYPGMAYLMSQRKLRLACTYLDFPAAQAGEKIN